MCSNKVNCWTTCVALIVFSVCGTAFGSILVYDGFDTYSNATVVGQSGGTGWGAAWTGFQSNRESVIDNGLSYSNGLVIIDGGDKALEMIGGQAGYVVQRALNSNADATNLYFRYLYRMASNTFTDDEFDGFMLEENAGDDDVNALNVAQDYGTIMTRLSLGTTSNLYASAGDPVYNNTYLILAKFERDAAGNYTKASLWVNPDGTDEASPDAETDGTATGWIDSVGRILLRTGGTTTSADKMVYDEIVLSDSWDSALAIPEPFSVGLLGIGGLLACVLRRMHRR
jgi:hypothetical protein